MTDKDRKEIRKIIREEIDAKLTSKANNASASQQKAPVQKNESKGQINIETVSPAY